MNILFAGGGTGGHVFPAIAIAEALHSINPAIKISFAGTKEKIEARIIPSLGYDFYTLWISGLQRGLSWKNILFPVKVIVSMLQAFDILNKVNPDAVIGSGGYVSGPVLFAASMRGIPTIIQEQNSYPGITTRLLAKRVDQVHVTFAASRHYLKNAKEIIVSGNPIRSTLHRSNKARARERFGLRPERTTVFVFGGSLGASAINHAVLPLIPTLAQKDIQVIWQTGTKDFPAIDTSCREYRSHVAVRSFIDEIHIAYSACDLAMCRAGASSLAELTTLGIPSVLIPYPYAAANHQYHNAQAMVESGAAILVPEEKIFSLEQVVISLLSQKEKLDSMSERARALGRPDAALSIARAVIALVQKKTNVQQSRENNGIS